MRGGCRNRGGRPKMVRKHAGGARDTESCPTGAAAERTGDRPLPEWIGAALTEIVAEAAEDYRPSPGPRQLRLAGELMARLEDVTAARPNAYPSNDGAVVLEYHAGGGRGRVVVEVDAEGTGAVTALRGGRAESREVSAITELPDQALRETFERLRRTSMVEQPAALCGSGRPQTEEGGENDGGGWRARAAEAKVALWRAVHGRATSLELHTRKRLYRAWNERESRRAGRAGERR